MIRSGFKARTRSRFASPPRPGQAAGLGQVPKGFGDKWLLVVPQRSRPAEQRFRFERIDENGRRRSGSEHPGHSLRDLDRTTRGIGNASRQDGRPRNAKQEKANGGQARHVSSSILLTDRGFLLISVQLQESDKTETPSVQRWIMRRKYTKTT